MYLPTLPPLLLRLFVCVVIQYSGVSSGSVLASFSDAQDENRVN